MPKIDINKKSSFVAFETLLALLEKNKPASLPDGLASILADRVRRGIEDSDYGKISALASSLEDFYRQLFVNMPERSQEGAMRQAGRPDEEGAFLLGQVAFAHLITARTLDRRADERFLQSIRDRRYERYVRSLQREPMTTTQLSEELKERLETVSRKLSILRRLGIVSSRKEGTFVLNSLTPATVALLKNYHISPLTAPLPEVQKVMDGAVDMLAPHLRAMQSFGNKKQRIAA